MSDIPAGWPCATLPANPPSVADRLCRIAAIRSASDWPNGDAPPRSSGRLPRRLRTGLISDALCLGTIMSSASNHIGMKM